MIFHPQKVCLLKFEHYVVFMVALLGFLWFVATIIAPIESVTQEGKSGRSQENQEGVFSNSCKLSWEKLFFSEKEKEACSGRWMSVDVCMSSASLLDKSLMYFLRG
jgi:hypothetical protein